MYEKERLANVMAPGLRDAKFYEYYEPQVRELLALLHSRGFQTIASCEGHSEPDYFGRISNFEIRFYIPSEEKRAELEALFGELQAKLLGTIPESKLSDLKLIAEQSRQGHLYMRIVVEGEHWSEVENQTLRASFSKLVRAGVSETDQLEKAIARIRRITE